ncbi:transcriptional regulator [Nocardioides sp. GXQ0305]|uniref:transcriptional regulator n=1 Tax=Nocardioides sp. GXQ0305 TaxID=3423912 RepID=UPI003D7CCD00
MTSSDPALLVLHAVRLLGFAPTAVVAERFDLDPAYAGELLEDHRALGWVTWSSFADATGWSLTERGRVEGEARLARELEATGRRDLVHRSYLEFLDLNARVLQAVTDWQTRPVAGDPLAANDHQDLRWDTRVLQRLADAGGGLAPIGGVLSGVLDRMAGYPERYESALARARAGEREWVDGLGRDSCHTVWFQLHEDLLATLGIPRGHEPR